jgi:aminoglycoside phosphotransferase (APT) family kinase protein
MLKLQPAPPLLNGVASRPAIDNQLLQYLSQRLELPGLRYLHKPKRIADGWETSIYHFQLHADEPLPQEFRGPLTLRLFVNGRAIPLGRHSLAVQSFLGRLHYPVPKPICWEEARTALGGPFLLMEQIPGPTLLQRLLSSPWKFPATVRQMAEMQARLHRLPTIGFPCPPEPFLQRSLDEIEDTISHYHLDSLIPPLQWLKRHLPAPPTAPCIVHLDFHPGNLIYREKQWPVVLDWDTADMADPHADIAKTVLLMRSASNMGQNLWEQMVVAAGRDLLESVYLFACRRRMDLDADKLAYYLAWAALLRLSRCCRCLIASPRAAGIKPSWTRHLHRDHLKALCDLFQRTSGVPVRLEEESWRVQPT